MRQRLSAAVLSILLAAVLPVLAVIVGSSDVLAGELGSSRVVATAEDPAPPVATASMSVEAATAERQAALAARGLECPEPISGSVAPVDTERSAADGRIVGTTSDDLQAFADRYNEIRVTHCLQPVPLENFRYDRCMEDRLVWMAEDPSDDPLSAWGHIGSERSDGVPSVGCDGNLAGGSHDTGATVADRWWSSDQHRHSLYRVDYPGAMAGVCIHVAMTHGGVGTSVDEPRSFLRAAARWGAC